MTRRLQPLVAGCVVLALLVCAQARAQVSEQVPSDAAGMLAVKNLEEFSGKIAHFAASVGLTEMDPRWKEPLASLQEQFGVKQGLDKSGDMAIAFFNPHQDGQGHAAGGPPPHMVLLPVSDYKEFLGNFKDVKDAGDGISEVTVPKNNEKLFIEKRGKYAVAAMDKDILSHKGGMKLEGLAAKESQSKDAIIHFNFAVLRPLLQQGLQQARQGMEQGLKQQQQGGANANPLAPQVTPAMKAMVNQYFKLADEFVNDTKTATIGLGVSDAGISWSAAAAFEPDSYCGKLTAQVKNTDTPMLAGLPQRTYFAFGGMQIAPQVMSQVLSDFFDPIKKELGGDNSDAAKGFDAMKRMMEAVRSSAFGYVMPAGGAGESLIQMAMVSHGDAKTILKNQKEALPAAGSFAGMGGGNVKVNVNMDPPKDLDGIQVQPYTMKFEFDQNSPMGAQQQQMMNQLYGRNGLTGMIGAVDDKTVVGVQGGNEKLMSDLIASAKGNSDTLDEAAHVKEVASHLPHERAVEFYVAIDNIITGVLNWARQNGFGVNMKLPPNLPPLGFNAGTDGSQVRMDAFIPQKTIQSITSAAIQTYMQMKGGPGGAGPGI